MKVLTTNWINVLGVFAATFISVFISVYFLHSGTFVQALFGAFLSVCLYGMMFWGLFVLSLIVIDLILFVRNQTNLKVKLLSEWLIISSPFIYWTIKYNEWIFLVAIVAFFITQMLRERPIKKTLV